MVGKSSDLSLLFLVNGRGGSEQSPFEKRKEGPSLVVKQQPGESLLSRRHSAFSSLPLCAGFPDPGFYADLTSKSHILDAMASGHLYPHVNRRLKRLCPKLSSHLPQQAPLPRTHDLLCFFPMMVSYSTLSSVLTLDGWDHLTPCSPNPLVFNRLRRVPPALLLFSALPSAWSLEYNILAALLLSRGAPAAARIHVVDIATVFIFMKLKALARTRETQGPARDWDVNVLARQTPLPRPTADGDPQRVTTSTPGCAWYPGLLGLPTECATGVPARGGDGSSLSLPQMPRGLIQPSTCVRLGPSQDWKIMTKHGPPAFISLGRGQEPQWGKRREGELGRATDQEIGSRWLRTYPRRQEGERRGPHMSRGSKLLTHSTVPCNSRHRKQNQRENSLEI